jgi:hypothetical protein
MKETEPGILNLNTKEAYLAWVAQNENLGANKIASGD